MSRDVTCVVLAAGFSRRFGGVKQLHEIDGEPLVHRAARVAREVAPTIVVIPSNAPAIREAVRSLDVMVIENGHAEEGMASSIRTGVTACSGDVLLLLCDQPGVDAAHLRALLGAGNAASRYSDGTIGVPAFFTAPHREDLLALRGDTGARALLRECGPRLVPLRDSRDLDRNVERADVATGQISPLHIIPTSSKIPQTRSE